MSVAIPPGKVVFLGNGNGTSSSAVIADNAVVRGDGGGRGIQGSGLQILDVAANTVQLDAIANDLLLSAISGTGATLRLSRSANGDITLTPSGTGVVSILASGAQTNAVKVRNSSASGYSSVDFYTSADAASGSFGYANASVSPVALQGRVFYNSSTGISQVWSVNAGVKMMLAAATGNLLLGGLPTDGTGVLQFPAATTSAGGITFGTDVNLFRTGAGQLAINDTSGTAPALALLSAGTQKGSLSFFSGAVYLNASASTSLILQSGNTTALTLDSSQNATFAGNVTVPAGGNLAYSTRGTINFNADGIIRLLNAAGTSFTSVLFGPATSSFPAWKRSTTGFQARLADDSGYTWIDISYGALNAAAPSVSAGQLAIGSTTASTVGAAGGASALPATPTGYWIINVAGTAMKVPYYAT